jgi:hypothetical protein
MDIENLSFLTEITDEDASYVNGGYIQDISDGLFAPFPGAPFPITLTPLIPYLLPDWTTPFTPEPFEVLPY